MKLYREIADGIIESLLRDSLVWDLVKHENPKEDYFQHESGNKVYVYSGVLLAPNGAQVNLPDSLAKEITEFTILKKRNERKFNELRNAILSAHDAFHIACDDRQS